MIYLTMVFMHIFDDYYLQGILADLKQKEHWKIIGILPKKYKYDYIVALVMHSFSWAFMIMLPVAYTMKWDITGLFVLCFVANVVIHAFVDDLKANRFKINLLVDQSIHIAQIIITAFVLL